MIVLLFSLASLVKSDFGIQVGNSSSFNHIDIYLDPISAKTTEFYVQFQQTIVDYRNYANMQIHPSPSKNNNENDKLSHLATKFLYAIGNLNLTAEQNTDVLFYTLFTNPFINSKAQDSDEKIINYYAQQIELKFKIKSSLILNSFKQDQELNSIITDVLKNCSQIELPSILFNGVLVPFYGFKSFIYYNIKDIQKVSKRKSFRLFRKNKDKKGIQRYSEIYFGMTYAKYVFDIYFDPVNKRSKQLISQVEQILQNYSTKLKIIVHVVPSPENKNSFILSKLINSVKMINPTTVTKFLPWIIKNHQDLFYNDKNLTENEILNKILPHLDSDFGINQTLVLKKYVTVENDADCIGSIFNLVLEKIKSLPFAKINGYSISLDDDTDLVQLFKEHLLLNDKSFNYQNTDDL